MALAWDAELPKLGCNKTSSVPIPRRYEQMKPVLTRNCTHVKIIEMGNELYQQTLDNCEARRMATLQNQEHEIWALANDIKREALEEAAQKAAVEQDKAMKKLTRIYEKTVKTVLHVEAKMQQTMDEAVHDTRNTCGRQLQEAVTNTRQDCHEQLLASVHEARLEERQVAAQEAAIAKQEEQERIEAIIIKSEDSTAQALNDFEREKNMERERAVDLAHKEEAEVARQKLQSVVIMYEKQLSGLRNHLKIRNEACRGLKDKIEVLVTEKQKIQKEMLALRVDFQHFINNTQPFEKDKAGYLMAPIRSFNLP